MYSSKNASTVADTNRTVAAVAAPVNSAARENQRVPSSLNELAAALVAIDSVNPTLVPGGAGEGQIASFVADWCGKHGLEVETESLRPDVPQLVMLSPPRGPGAAEDHHLVARPEPVHRDGGVRATV